MAKKHQKKTSAGVTSPNLKAKDPETSVQVDLKKLINQSNLSSAKPLIEAIEAKREGSKLLCLVYNDNPPVPTMLRPSTLMPFEQLLSQIGRVPRLDLFLRCTGGITEVPWRIVSLLREFTDSLSVIVSSIALSGATHIAIAADELVMTPFAVLGSVDPKRLHPLLPKDAAGKPIPTSVEDLKHCIKFIQEQLGESYHEQDLALIISELFKYINPLAIGAIEQSFELAKLITRKCLKSRKEPLDEKKIENIIEQLSGKYYSHSFYISRGEVEDDLGLPVTRPDDELSKLIQELGDHFSKQFQKVIQAAPPNAQPLFRVGGVMQTTTSGWAIASLFQPDGKLMADPWIEFKEEEIIS